MPNFHHAKHIARRTAVEAGQLPKTGEDADLERRTEPLRLSPVLLLHANSLSDLNRSEVQLRLWATLLSLEGATLNALRVDATSHGVTMPRPKANIKQASDILERLFQHAPEAAALPREHVLSQHEHVVGFVLTMIRRMATPLWSIAPRGLLRGKTNVTSLQRRSFFYSKQGDFGHAPLTPPLPLPP